MHPCNQLHFIKALDLNPSSIGFAFRISGLSSWTFTNRLLQVSGKESNEGVGCTGSLHGRLKCITDGYNTISCGYPVRSKSIMCGQSFQKLPILHENNRKTHSVNRHLAVIHLPIRRLPWTSRKDGECGEAENRGEPPHRHPKALRIEPNRHLFYQ